MTDDDFAAIKPWIAGTDLAMLAYWTVTAAKATGLVAVPDEWLFSDYTNPVVVAWNWSFLPLDIVFSVCGLSATALHRRGHPGWKPLAVISLVLTWCAGFMAVSFWAVRVTLIRCGGARISSWWRGRWAFCPECGALPAGPDLPLRVGNLEPSVATSSGCGYN